MSVWAGLIERLEKAKESSRELDVLIAYMGRDVELIGIFEPETIGVGNATACLRLDGKQPAFIKMGNVPAYTSSFEAALTLIPTGLDYELLRTGADGPPRSEATVHMKPYMKSKTEDEMRGEAATDALALCIAALKARVSHGVDGPG